MKFLVQPQKNSNEKLVGLELVRFISAVAILFWHYQHFDSSPISGLYIVSQRYPFYDSFGFLYDNGLQAVRIFWCISGFIFYWKYGDAIAQQAISKWIFFVNRFSRLYPLHALTLILVTCMQLLYFSKRNTYFVYSQNNLQQFFLQVIFASNWDFKSSLSFNGPIWSVSVEVLVYVIFFYSLRLWGKVFYCTLAMLFISLCINRILAISQINIAVDFPLADCLVLFFAGGISAIIALKVRKLNYRLALNIMSLVGVVLIPFMYSMYVKTGEGHTFLFLLFYLPILLFAISSINLPFPVSLNKLVTALGNMTYSSYLIHFPIQLLIALICAYLELSIPFLHKWFFLGYMVGVLIISYYLYVWFEKPLQIYLRKRMIT